MDGAIMKMREAPMPHDEGVSAASWPECAERFDYSLYLTSVAAFVRSMRRLFAGSDIGLTEYRMLLRPSAHRGRSKAFELAEMLGLDPSTVALSLCRLESLSAITRSDCLNDRRETMISLTARGVEYVSESRELLAPFMTRLWREVPSSLHGYVRDCTLLVAESSGLFSRECAARPVDVALFDEMCLTIGTVARFCAHERVSLAGFRMLLALKDEPEGMHPGKLAMLLRTRPSNIASASKQLQSASLVRRSRDCGDRRAVILEITSDGWEAWSRIDAAVFEYLSTGLLPKMTSEDIEKHHGVSEALLSSSLYVG